AARVLAGVGERLGCDVGRDGEPVVVDAERRELAPVLGEHLVCCAADLGRPVLDRERGEPVAEFGVRSVIAPAVVLACAVADAGERAHGRGELCELVWLHGERLRTWLRMSESGPRLQRVR